MVGTSVKHRISARRWAHRLEARLASPGMTALLALFAGLLAIFYVGFALIALS